MSATESLPFSAPGLGVTMTFHPNPGHPISAKELRSSPRERRRRGNRLKERDPEAGHRLGSPVPGVPGLNARRPFKASSAQLPEGRKAFPNADDSRSGRSLKTPPHSGERRREGFPRRRSGPNGRDACSWIVFGTPQTAVIRVRGRKPLNPGAEAAGEPPEGPCS